jgi:hypothetical protein
VKKIEDRCQIDADIQTPIRAAFAAIHPPDACVTATVKTNATRDRVDDLAAS